MKAKKKFPKFDTLIEKYLSEKNLEERDIIESDSPE